MPEEKNMPAAAAYIRVSTDDQAELSPDSQLEEIKKYASREGLRLLPDQIYIDSGISGKRAGRRPAFLRMVAAAKEPGCPFSVILLWKFSRFARNQEESIFYKSILRSKCGIDVVSVTEPLMAGPFGSLIERIIEWMDEFYSIRLSQEVRRSMLVNAQRGRLQAAPAFGYRAEGGALTPREDEAVRVRLIFQRFQAGGSLGGIARELNELGARTRRGNPFESRSVEYILRNPVYIGKLRWNPSCRTGRNFDSDEVIIADGGHPPLVDRALWEAVQARLEREKSGHTARARPARELRGWSSGLVRCAACGSVLRFVQPRYYRCGGYARGLCAHSQHVPAQELENAILSRLQADVRGAPPLSYAPIPRKDSGLESELGRLERKNRRLREAYLAGAVELEAFLTLGREIDADIRRVRDRLAESPTALAQVLETLQMPDAALEDKMSAARSVIETCTLDRTNALLAVTYRLKLPAAGLSSPDAIGGPRW